MDSSKMVEERKPLMVEDILTESQISHIVTQAIGNSTSWDLKRTELKNMDGMPGYLGDHFKAVLYIDVQDEERKIHLFIKRMPFWNKPKTKFIEESNFYNRERLMFKIMEEICEDGLHTWCVKAYFYTDSLLVMPDLTVQGYSTRQCLQVLDSDHIFVTTTSVAQFHAACVNYETKKSLHTGQPYRISGEFGSLLTEPIFCDSPFLRSCSKLSTNLIKQLSSKSYRDLENLEGDLTQLYIEACDTFKEYDETINVLIHKDLWVNNLMFKYDNDVPVNCVLVDYQCLRYGPPAFDLMMFIYLTTDRPFRQERENDVLGHYYTVFIRHLNEDSKRRIEALEYDKDNFLRWCEKARMFGMLGSIAIQPFTLMDPNYALKTLHAPATYEKYVYEDRTEPVVAHALCNEAYKYRLMDVTEEFVETYLLK